MKQLIQINAENLRKALKDIEAAEKNGFMYCEAVFDANYRNDTWIEATYSDMWEKAHPTDGSLNWGRNQDVTKRNTFKDGKLIPTPEAQKARDAFPDGVEVEKGEIDGYTYWIVPAPKHAPGALNGYVLFPQRITVEGGYDGMLQYVPVHGGITYAQQKGEGMVYGFDTLHADSEEKPRTDKAWIKKQITKMIKGILKASEVEKKYLLAKTEKEKAECAQEVLDTDTEKENQYNFNIGINLLTGKL